MTLIDLGDVYMTVFLRAADAGKLAIGDEARIILNAAPDYVVPAMVSFVACEAQAAPKAVETKDDLAKLMLRVDLKVDPKVVETYYGKVETGLRGAGFVRTRPDAKWPADLHSQAAARARCAGAKAASRACRRSGRHRIDASRRRSFHPIGACSRVDLRSCPRAQRRGADLRAGHADCPHRRASVFARACAGSGGERADPASARACALFSADVRARSRAPSRTFRGGIEGFAACAGSQARSSASGAFRSSCARPRSCACRARLHVGEARAGACAEFAPESLDQLEGAWAQSAARLQ